MLLTYYYLGHDHLQSALKKTFSKVKLVVFFCRGVSLSLCLFFFVHLPLCCLLYDSKLKNAPIIDIHNDDCTSKIEAICCCWTSNHNKESACVVRIFLILRLLIMRLSASYNTMSVYIWWAIINAPFWWYTCLPSSFFHPLYCALFSFVYFLDQTIIHVVHFTKWIHNLKHFLTIHAYSSTK